MTGTAVPGVQGVRRVVLLPAQGGRAFVVVLAHTEPTISAAGGLLAAASPGVLQVSAFCYPQLERRQLCRA